MTSSEIRIAEAVAALTVRLEAWSVDDASSKAHTYVRDMLDQGWRPTAAYNDQPAQSWAPGNTAAGVAACRAGLAGRAL